VPDRVDLTASDASVRSLERSDLESGDLEASLRAVAEATSALFQADGGGIMLVDEQGSLHYVGATSGKAAALEAAQEETGEGPCVDSLMHAVVVHTPDLTEDERWPRLRAEIQDLGVHAVLGVPLRVESTPVGSLNVYRQERYAWEDADISALRAHATVVDHLLTVAVRERRQETIVGQLTSALEHRVLIDRAIGVVMATLRLDSVDAFNVLRSDARGRRVRVAELAAEVLEGRTYPPKGPTTT
jgi:transcriptional regulator with GAF, ATPase, and Fis domain